jgi:hypothetical protein
MRLFLCQHHQVLRSAGRNVYEEPRKKTRLDNGGNNDRPPTVHDNCERLHNFADALRIVMVGT